MSPSGLLLLAASRGHGGGIERVVDAVERAAGSRARRIDLHVAGVDARPIGDPVAKAAFAVRAVRAASARRWRWVVCLHAGLLPVAAAAAHVAGARLALFAYGTEVWAPVTPLQRRLTAHADRRIAISRYTAEWLARRARISVASVRTIPLPVSDLFAAHAARGPTATVREPHVLTVSRLAAEHRYKGHHAVAAAWPLVVERCPAARWVVVGDGDDRPALERRVSDLGIADSVRFTGPVSDAELAELYGSATVLVLPSVADAGADPPQGEGFGLVYAEAAAYGVPSIASTRGGGALDFVRHDETGLLAPEEPEALAAAIGKVLCDHELRARLGGSARELVLARHVPHRFESALAELLD